MQKTGNSNEDTIQLTDLEERICDIFGKFGVGLSVIPELGIVMDQKVKNTPFLQLYSDINEVFKKHKYNQFNQLNVYQQQSAKTLLN